jgi:hypothetical protein
MRAAAAVRRDESSRMIVSDAVPRPEPTRDVKSTTGSLTARPKVAGEAELSDPENTERTILARPPGHRPGRSLVQERLRLPGIVVALGTDPR